jgi:dihydroxyacetone kinase DhaKLM complex PTS-EIIA-like component DhaM
MFFFNVQTIDGVNEEDTVGADFPTVEEAVAEAETLANEMMLDATKARHNVKQIIEVADERGNVILRLDCSAAIQATVLKPSDHI